MNPWTIRAIAALVLFALGFTTGWTVNTWRHDSADLAQVVEDKEVVKELHYQEVPIVHAAQEKDREIKIVYRTVREKINHENDNNICFTAESLGLWNAAIGGADLHTPEPIRTPGENEALVATVEEVLLNAADNFETCNTNAVKHNALIDKVETLNGKMCVCSE